MHAQQNFSAVFAVAALLVSIANAQPGRFPCGKTTPNQQVCDLLSHPTARRGVLVPIDSECVKAGTGYACGWTGARCTSDLQCDFGSCSGSASSPGVCIGGLGDPCEGSDGPDDSLCAGNLGCQVDVTDGGGANGAASRYVCGGAGADCSFSGNYESSSRPNHLACVSGWCNPSSLSCGTRSESVMARVHSEQRVYTGGDEEEDVAAEDAARHASRRKSIPLPDGAACPAGFSACPIPRKNSPSDYLFACYDFLSSETHCGGCHDVGAGFWQERQPGVDCTQLPGVASASCVSGQCQIVSCSDGHQYDRDLSVCVPMRYW